MAAKSLAELDDIMAEFDLTPQRIAQFFSGEPEERARAGIGWCDIFQSVSSACFFTPRQLFYKPSIPMINLLAKLSTN